MPKKPTGRPIKHEGGFIRAALSLSSADKADLEQYRRVLAADQKVTLSLADAILYGVRESPSYRKLMKK